MIRIISYQCELSENNISDKSKESHRAICSLIEELEAIDVYSQRLDASSDKELEEVLSHSLEEEMDHAAKTLELIRKHIPDFDKALKKNLFK